MHCNAWASVLLGSYDHDVDNAQCPQRAADDAVEREERQRDFRGSPAGDGEVFVNEQGGDERDSASKGCAKSFVNAPCRDEASQGGGVKQAGDPHRTAELRLRR